ncbi:hypothetical protein MBLNU457_g0378t1 [Dothideomycetes sp. NU457]
MALQMTKVKIQQVLKQKHHRESGPLGLSNRKPDPKNDKLYAELRREKRTVQSSMKKHRGRLGPHDQRGYSKTRTKFVSIGRPLRKRTPRVPINKELKTASKEEGQGKDADKKNEGETLSFATGDFSNAWNLNYSRINARFEQNTDATYSVHSDKDLLLHPDAGTWAEAILSTKTERITPSPLMRDARRNAGEAVTWNRLWTHAMLWTLRHKPNEGTRFLALTHVSPFVSRTWIEDSVAYLARHFAASSNADGAIKLAETLMILMERPGAPSLQLRESQVRLLLPFISVDQILQLLAVIKTNHVYVHGQTLLHMSSHLARSGALRESMECLLEAPEYGTKTDDKAFLSVCATILRRTSDQPEGLRICLTIIQNLVNIGVRINVQLCNIVILNAVEAGDLSTAFSVYHSLVDHGLQADAYTYAIILKGCKKAFKDTETLHATIQSTVRGTDLTKETTVASEVLHCLYLFHFGTNPSSAWPNISIAYRQMFDTKPLETLGILTPTTWRATTQVLGQPSLAAIGIMLSAWLRSTSRQKTQLFQVYDKFRTLARSGETPFAEMAKTDHIFNLFLKIFCNSGSMLPLAADVIRDMQSSTKATAPTQSHERLEINTSEETDILDGPQNDAVDSPTEPTATFCKPTVRSWSILLKGFTKSRKMDLAEQVLAYMRKQGIEPNLVTWNSLFDGYAGMRNPDGALTAYRRMEQAGFAADEYTETSARKVGLSIADLERDNQLEEARLKIENQEEES